ncbi:MAG TPA: VWA domain-containing protein, partial [Candidatus Methylomirabilis sp.]|nr:VWA domain-containing protein [Candidatus Methylomirabilis sp.]
PGEAADAVRALEAVDLADREEVRCALRAILTTRVEDFPAFDDCFTRIWAGAERFPEKPPPRLEDVGDRRPAGDEGPPARVVPGAGGAPKPLLERWVPGEAGREDEGEPTGLAASDAEVLMRKDFGAFAADELDEVARLAAQVARRLAFRVDRRGRATRRHEQVDLRRTFRGALRTGGDMIALAWRQRRRRRPRLVLLLDVSGSMDLYSRFLLLFLYAMQNGFRRVETFTFGTRLTRVTDDLRGRPFPLALGRLAEEVRDWSGGTRIGESLAVFNRTWAERCVDRRTVVVVLSDGWDTGEPELLAGELARLRRRAARLLWLNPLLGSPDYRPLTRGMAAALPHLDTFAPAHNLESLSRLGRHLART